MKITVKNKWNWNPRIFKCFGSTKFYEKCLMLIDFHFLQFVETQTQIKRSEKLLSVTVKYWWVRDNPPNTKIKLRSIPNSIYNIYNPLGIKHLTRLGIRHSHLKEQINSGNSFQDSIDPMAAVVVVLKQLFIFFSPLHKFQ